MNLIAPIKRGLSKADEHVAHYDNTHSFKRRRMIAAADTISTFQSPRNLGSRSIPVPANMTDILARADYVRAMLDKEAPQLQAYKTPHLQFSLDFQLVGSAMGLTEEELNACFNIIHSTSGDDYKASSIGWNPKQKKDEMRDHEMMYVLVRQGDVVGNTVKKVPAKEVTCAKGKTAVQPNALDQLVTTYADDDEDKPPTTADPNSLRPQLTSEAPSPTPRNTNTILGFISFMFTHDDPPHQDREVVYIYEVHLHENLRGRGLGSNLVEFVEKVARRFNISKTMLTVFMSNYKAKAVYKRLGYAKDECSPQARVMRSKTIKPDYVIMSKGLL
ncbi:acyl-CoA N-acyltransferase [Dothidotthia symphoricarpi CBS 119687]|uniref:N-alpha-acetyltransferase 40 n=1 Tax=Dothidotthia symphoricarpi CBS 119687 TaxID=1392245 RepID=A0A6A6ASZ4_9PLEO|nr:acyl-CoA N-acyltransferase [Dothidotthia symphoricarpi CBS 119687]KAF2134095.1 acyl-CoA N-acyltransferase [Dothidotthia symphoricarpi CBS 119687]